MEALQPLGDGRWLIVVDLGEQGFRLDVYEQEEELAPPLKVGSFTVDLGRSPTVHRSLKPASADGDLPMTALGAGADPG
jgi:hypothetical protein